MGKASKSREARIASRGSENTTRDFRNLRFALHPIPSLVHRLPDSRKPTPHRRGDPAGRLLRDEVRAAIGGRAIGAPLRRLGSGVEPEAGL